MTEKIEGAISERSTLTEAEKSFVHKIAEHYHITDGMEWERGYVIGWLIINYPAKQSANEIAKALDIPASRWTGSPICSRRRASTPARRSPVPTTTTSP
ncbi:hypothetical protein HFP71_34290 [Streptomyces sp. ARC32]